jgi:hypothetical protein
MARSFDMAAEYEGSVEQVHRAFCDERYWLARLADSGADDALLDELDVGAGGVLVRTTQVLRPDRLPGLVSQFHRGDLRIERQERWSAIHDGWADAVVIGTIPGAPVTLNGAAELVPANSGGGSRLEFKTTIGVDIPLVGGKIENFIRSRLVDLLIAEQRFTTVWIAEND